MDSRMQIRQSDPEQAAKRWTAADLQQLENLDQQLKPYIAKLRPLLLAAREKVAPLCHSC